MSLRKASRKCMISYVLLILIVFIIIAFVLIYHSVKHHLAELCRYKCGEILNTVLADTASEAADSGQEYYDLIRDSSGRVLSVEADTSALNELQSFLRRTVNRKISDDEYDNVSFTLGDLTDIAYFSGRGPEINIRYQRSGTVDTNIRTTFESAGINQTRLKVYITVSVEFTAFLPTGEEHFKISEEYVAADTVIVGEVPDYYTRDAIV